MPTEWRTMYLQEKLKFTDLWQSVYTLQFFFYYVCTCVSMNIHVYVRVYI